MALFSRKTANNSTEAAEKKINAKPSRIQKRKRRAVLSKRMHMSVWVCIFLGLTAGGLWYYQSQQEEQRKTLDRSVRNMRRDVTKLTAENKQFQEAYSVFVDIPEQKKATNFADLPSRIRVLQPILRDMRRDFFLSRLEADVASVNQLDGKFQVGNLGTSSARLRLTFSGLSDELIFAFLDKIRETLPGYLRLNTLVMDRQRELNNSVLREIADGRRTEVVSGEAVFEWKVMEKN